MKFLVDTNIVIRAEPTGPADVEPGTPVALELLTGPQIHNACLHAAMLAYSKDEAIGLRHVARAARSVSDLAGAAPAAPR